MKATVHTTLTPSTSFVLQYIAWRKDIIKNKKEQSFLLLFTLL